jgi:hypothetical protein
LQHDGNGTVQEVTKGKMALFKGTQAFMMPRGKQSLKEPSLGQTSHFCPISTSISSSHSLMIIEEFELRPKKTP